MRVREGSRQSVAAPRYRAAAGEQAAHAAVHDDLRAEAARTQVARFFYDLRRGLRMARVAIANRIGTDPGVIEALETGNLAALPPWPQTLNIVTNYARLVHLDPRPVLNALHFAMSHRQQMLAKEGLVKRLYRKLAGVSRAFSEAHHQRSHVLTWAAGIGVPAVLMGSLALTSGLQASQLPRPLASMLGFDQASRAESIKRLEGLVWIDATDPRQRRGDKLPGSAR
jgi:hypothetical protein